MESTAGVYKLQPDNHDLDHIQGSDGIPYFGNSLSVLFDWEKFCSAQLEYGTVSRMKMLKQRGICMQGADNMKLLFLDQDRNFSPEMGYEESLSQFYRGGLLMRDFDDHKFQRRIMQTAFKTPAMKTYVELMNPIMHRYISEWNGSKIEFFPAIKLALLEVGAMVFLGVDKDSSMLPKINKAFLDINDGLLGQLRKEIPGTRYNKGKKAQHFLSEFLRVEISRRRNSDKQDMFSHMCKEKTDNGEYFSDDDIIGHIAFLLFAAHDTTTSVLTNIIMFTAKNPEWQVKMREECEGIDKLDYEDIGQLEVIERCFQESLRLRPSVPLAVRRTIRNCEIDGVKVPGNTMVFASNLAHHKDPKYWTNPELFDPDRFLPERAEHKNHTFCYTPFGGGAHKCIGMHFASMLSKTMMFNILKSSNYSLPANYKSRAEWFPLPKPRKLPVTFSPL